MRDQVVISDDDAAHPPESLDHRISPAGEDAHCNVAGRGRRASADISRYGGAPTAGDSMVTARPVRYVAGWP